MMDHSSSLPPLESLPVVLAAARNGSFTAAAEELGLTHGAVSRRVAAVENWLGTPLFERHGRGVRATPAGLRFTTEVERAFVTISRTAERWRPVRGVETVRLSVLPSVAKLWLLPRMPRLMGEPRDLRIELRIEHRLADLEAGEADIVLRYGRGGWPDLLLRELFGETLQPVANAHLAERLGAEPSAELLGTQAVIHDSDTSQWRRFFAARGIRYRPRANDLRFEDYDLVLAAAEAGLGLAFLRRPLADAWLQEGRLLPVGSEALRNPSSHYVALRLDENRPAVLRLAERLFALSRETSRLI